MKLLYIIFIELLRVGLWLGSFFNDKLKKGWQGRKQSFAKVGRAFTKRDKVIWMHAASLGEYEQGLPVLEKLKQQYPDYKILVSFFSPSGYENVVKKKTIADVICYLPLDRKSEIRAFLDLMNIQIFFTVKYDYWYHLLNELKKRKVKVFVISALFYPNQVFFKSYGRFFVQQLKNNIDWFFHQNKASFDLAKNIGLEKSSIAGDTRYDRVKENAQNAVKVPFIKDFLQGQKCVVFGSAWQAEEKVAEILAHQFEGKIIIAPHDLKRVQNLLQIFPNALRYSEFENKGVIAKSQILIIDCIGLLSNLYAYADVSVVGGGFHSAGLHNILESAVFGNPVLFGNQYQNHPEADDLIRAKGGQSFRTEEMLAEELMCLLNNDEKRLAMSENARQFIIHQPNASRHILTKIATDFSSSL
ncbi:MAG: 3-deoxy-D-manno-octulosonic acid transferase [Flavobacteriales bacterium]|nr:MAG: 3-deoxy-D-manno-octulosonic acid transferase [Flavobacteriales bacterium]